MRSRIALLTRGRLGAAPRQARALSRRRSRGAACAALLVLQASPVLASVTVQSFSLQPSAPTTGDPLVLHAVIQSTSSCAFLDARILFGPQPELGGTAGFGIDVEFQDGSLPIPSSCPVDVSLGFQQVEAGDGVLRARNGGVVDDVKFFSLEVGPGPAPGWDGPSVHGGFSLLVQSAAATFLPGRLAISDLLSRKILLLDPDTGDALGSFNAPGSGDVRGLAWDGSSVYAAVRDAAPHVYKVDLLGRVLDVFNSPVISPGSAPLEGLAWLDGVLYGSYASPPRLFAINPVTHVKIWDRALPTRILALDAVPGGLIGADEPGTFYFIEPSPTGEDTVLADPLDTGITGFPQFAGLAFDGRGIDAWDAASSTMLFMRDFAVWWGTDGTLRTYVPAADQAIDVIRGDIDDAAQNSSFFDLAFFAPAVCLASRSGGGAVLDPDAPPAGHAFFYLARVIDAGGGAASYGRTTGGFRRVDTSLACP